MMPCGEGYLEEDEQSGGYKRTDFWVWWGMQRNRPGTECQAIRGNKRLSLQKALSLFSLFTILLILLGATVRMVFKLRQLELGSDLFKWFIHCYHLFPPALWPTLCFVSQFLGSLQPECWQASQRWEICFGKNSNIISPRRFLATRVSLEQS